MSSASRNASNAAIGEIDPAIARRGRARLVLPNIANSGITEFFCHLASGVRRPVVYDDYLDFADRLRSDAPQGIGQIGLPVEHRYDYRKRIGHGRLEWQMAVFRVNEPDVVYETFDDEIVVVNLDTGNYYSLSGTGPAIWADLAGGFGIDEIATRIQGRYTGGTDAILTAIAAFADRLVSEKLLIGAGDRVARAQSSSVEPAADQDTL